MTHKQLPAHGSEARYKGSKKRPPCRCRTCINGWTRAGQKRLLGRLEGRPATIPAEPVTRHINKLYAANMTTRQIAAESGVDATTIRSHAAGELTAIRRTSAEKILAVRPGRQPVDGWVPALGSIRRCRALYTLGHGAKDIAAAHPDAQLRTVEYLVQGRRHQITVACRNAIRDAYRILCQTAGNNQQAKHRALIEGWHGPLDWDDIDDPTCEPETEGRTDQQRRHKAVIDPARVAHLTRLGRSAEQIAAEIGCHPRSVIRARRRAEEMEIAA